MADTEDAPKADAESEEGAEKKPARKFSPKLLIAAAAGALVLAGGGTGAYFVFSGKEKSAVTAAQAKPAVFLDLPDVLVNLSNAGGDRTQYLKMKIVLELPQQEMIAQVQPMLPRVLDAFQTYLRELRPTDLDGSAGLYRLKEELTRRVNASIAPGRVNAVLFKEIVVQ
ncbi:MAG TPA: flagellar basal body-associated protein FliL [Pseudorhodoplanes sp.]|jgi:flagellar FliL protein|nr:flagellar basal body-associated protein FliL [Pseudorhodoplanes sp.]